jgi:N-glycosylase/DNA lyase
VSIPGDDPDGARVTEIPLEQPEPFDLDLTVRSHGFYDLAPWSYDADRGVLSRPLRLAGGRVVVAAVRRRGGRLVARVDSPRPPGPRDAAEVRRQLRICLALDEDLGPFYARVRAIEPSLRWAAERGAGRLLRSPTVFEDTLKTLCTTNCTWALTRIMVRNLVDAAGDEGPGGVRAFPTPSALADRPEAFFREVIRAGYRAGAMRTIARAVASGALDVERWRDPTIDAEALAGAIAELPGFGPYATEHLLRLLGRYDHLALDSWSRAKLARLRRKRRVPPDATMRRWFAPFGAFAGLAMWLEVTADWHGAPPTWP